MEAQGRPHQQYAEGSQRSSEAAVRDEGRAESRLEVLSNESQKRKRRRRDGPRSKATMACIQCRSSKLKCDGAQPRCFRCARSDQGCSWAKLDGRSSLAKIEGWKHDGSGALASRSANSAQTEGQHAPASQPIPDHSRASTGPPPPPQSRTLAEQRLWWESGTSTSPAPPSVDFDWSTLGLEPQDLTQDVLDTLCGQIAWIDQPNNTGSGSNLSAETVQEHRDAQVVRIQYFRLLGPTGISPGIKKVSMEFRLTPLIQKALFNSTSPSALRGRQRLDWDRLLSMGEGPREHHQVNEQASGRPEQPVDMFQGDLPAPWVLDELIALFFDRLGDHYLCLKRHGLQRRLAESGPRIPPMLVNIICALAARYSKHPAIVSGRGAEQSHSFGVIFADKAKLFLASALSVPSRTTTLAFLMMAWHEFGCNLDSAFWMYAGMALRMAVDLGIHRHSPLPVTHGLQDLNDVDFIDDALLFWAVYQMDRVLAMGTGRPTNIKDREITCPAPSIETNLLFAHHIKLTRIAGEVAEALNAVLLPSEAAREETRLQLDKLEDRLIESYELIPSSLHLTPQNFKVTSHKHSFLEFHLRFHCLILILNRAPVVEKRTSVDPTQALRLVRKSVQRCADIIALDESQDGEMLLSIPMANQTLFLAGCAELDELQQRQSQCSSQKDMSRSSRHLLLDAIEGYSRFANVLERMSNYWDGIRWIYGVLMQRKAGFMVDKLTELDVGTDTIASKQELRMLSRLHGGEFIHTTSPSQWPPSLQVSQVMSLDELASVFPQFRTPLPPR